MAKDPAFLFYGNDWQGGTMHMSLVEKGAYIELLMLQFNRDQFTIEQARHLLREFFDATWPTLKEKFQTDGTYFWNQRLRQEKEKRQKFTESRYANLSQKKQVTERKESRKAVHMDAHMGNGNGNRKLEIGNRSEIQVVEFEDFRLAYPGRKNGYKSEFKNYKRHEDWQDCLEKLIPGLENEKRWRSVALQTKKFVPEWANLSTWINQRRWDQTMPKIEAHELTREQNFELAIADARRTGTHSAPERTPADS